jgi:hypothetical protein
MKGDKLGLSALPAGTGTFIRNLGATFWRNMPPMMVREIDARPFETKVCCHISARGVSILLARQAIAEGSLVPKSSLMDPCGGLRS